MKSILLLSTIVAAVSAQRPSYAGSGPVGVPKLAARFATSENSVPSDSQFPNRLGADTDGSSSTLSIDRQYQKYWPRENLPFSVINEEHIRKQLYPDGIRRTSTQDVSTNDLGQGNDFVPVTNRNGQGINNRGSFDAATGDSPGSFIVFKNNKQVTYVYDPVNDAWYPSRD